MNDAAPIPEAGFLTTSELAGRADFALGRATVSPSRRLVSGPGGSAEVEPRVMQVLVALADALGTVVTRQQLFDRCWGVSNVGDDSLNRAVAGVRRIGADIAADSFNVETIPRTGYRLSAERRLDALALSADSAPDKDRTITRRSAVAATAGLVLAGAAGTYLWSARRRDHQIQALVDQGVEGLEYGDGTLEPAKYFSQAVKLDPQDAAAQGYLALALSVNWDIGSSQRQAIVTDAERAAAASLAIDPGNINAQLAMVQLRRASLDLASTEDRLRALLAAAPDNIFVMRQLWNLLQSTGRSRDALVLVNRAIEIRPLAAANNYPLGQLLWILGRPTEADRVLERAINYWPDHSFVRFARFNMLAYTGRARAAMAMLDHKATAPQGFSPDAVALLRTSLAALIDPTPTNKAIARKANVEGVEKDLALARIAVLPLAALGEVDAAFDVANALLAPDQPELSAGGGARPSSMAWRFTPWLFTPPTASMRADPRFQRLCDATGLTAYWRKRGIKPDYLAFPA